MLFVRFLSLIICRINADKMVSIENKNDHILRKDRNVYANVERRFIDNLDDKDWHISHLKESDFVNSRRDCSQETFDHKVKMYRKSLSQDASLVQFVSADALPFDVNDLKQDVCEAPDKKAVFKVDKTVQISKPTSNNSSTTITETVDATTVEGIKAEVDKQEVKAAVKIDDRDSVNVATTTTEKSGQPQASKSDSRRASEYLFSSIEYYDEGAVFDDSVCPDAVQVIELQQDHIRPYDLHCEQILVWRSLE